MLVKAKLYNQLKWLALIALPAFSAFYLSFGQLWDFPKTTEVVGSLTLIDTLLGALLQLSSKTYQKQQEDPANVDGYVTETGRDPDTGIPGLSFTISRHPDEFLEKSIVRMKVGPPPAKPTYRAPRPE